MARQTKIGFNLRVGFFGAFVGGFLDPEGMSQKATLVVVVVVVISSQKIPKAFLTCSRAQQNFHSC